MIKSLFPERFTPPIRDPGYEEPEVAKKLRVTRQTLRNWRMGYKVGKYVYPPVLIEGVHWWKIRQTRRAPVFYSREWVNRRKND